MPKPNGLSGVELTGATKEVRRLGLAEPTLVSRVVTRHSMSSQESLNLPNAPALRRGLMTMRQASAASQPPSLIQPRPQQRSLCRAAPPRPM
jgi:hypothetical protein